MLAVFPLKLGLLNRFELMCLFQIFSKVTDSQAQKKAQNVILNVLKCMAC